MQQVAEILCVLLLVSGFSLHAHADLAPQNPGITTESAESKTSKAAEQVPATSSVTAPPAPAASTQAPAAASAQTPASPTSVDAAVGGSNVEKKENKNGLAFGGQLALALQYWSKAGGTNGSDSDSKVGAGIGGTIGLGFQMDDLKVVIGPSFWHNAWSANYASKSQSSSDKVYLNLDDAGIALLSYFDDFFIQFEAGRTTITAGATVGNKDISYQYDDPHSTYKAFKIGFKTGILLLGLGITNYDGVANAANHANFMLGIGF